MDSVPDWRVYERVLASFELEVVDMDASVLANASLIGVSGVSRQVDVLVDARWDNSTERRIIYDAKLRKRKLDITDVDRFHGLMIDVRASRGVLVSSTGFTEAAHARAGEIIELRLMTSDEALDFNHSAVDPCPNCEMGSRKFTGVVFWDGQLPLQIEGLFAIVYTGKCDVCHSFAFWCWACGEKTLVPDGEIHVCGCGHTWAVPRDDSGALLELTVGEHTLCLDRRPLR